MRVLVSSEVARLRKAACGGDLRRGNGTDAVDDSEAIGLALDTTRKVLLFLKRRFTALMAALTTVTYCPATALLIQAPPTV